MGLVARPVFKTGLRTSRGRGGSIPPHSAPQVPHAALEIRDLQHVPGTKRPGPPSGQCPGRARLTRMFAGGESSAGVVANQQLSWPSFRIACPTRTAISGYRAPRAGTVHPRVARCNSTATLVWSLRPGRYAGAVVCIRQEIAGGKTASSLAWPKSGVCPGKE